MFVGGSLGRLHGKHFVVCSGFLGRLKSNTWRLSRAAVAVFNRLFFCQILAQAGRGHCHGFEFEASFRSFGCLFEAM